MMNLDELRQRIDQLDDQIVELLHQRAKLATEIGQHKQDNTAAVYDTAREAQILRRLAKLDVAPLPGEAIQHIYREILAACRSVQQPLRVAYLGPQYTFTHMATLQQFGRSSQLVPAGSITEVFGAVQCERADYGVVPVENSTGGVVPETLDCFLDSHLLISGELYVPVHLCVAARCELDEITTLYSHPQPLAQSRKWLRQNLSEVHIENVASTAVAAQRASEDSQGGAISTQLAIQSYGLEMLAENIEDEPANRTRFFVIGSYNAEPTGQDKTSIVFTTAHQAGALHAALAPLATHDINMTFIQSRPARGRLWEYVFFVDFEGHRSQPRIQQALEELGGHCPLLQVLGSYPAAE